MGYRGDPDSAYAAIECFCNFTLFGNAAMLKKFVVDGSLQCMAEVMMFEAHSYNELLHTRAVRVVANLEGGKVPHDKLKTGGAMIVIDAAKRAFSGQGDNTATIINLLGWCDHLNAVLYGLDAPPQPPAPLLP